MSDMNTSPARKPIRFSSVHGGPGYSRLLALFHQKPSINVYSSKLGGRVSGRMSLTVSLAQKRKGAWGVLEQICTL